MLLCPRCTKPLGDLRTDVGTEFVCASCGGRAATVPILRRKLSAETVNALWQGARASTRPGGLPCPACADGMGRAFVGEGEARVEADACARCQIVWLDLGETEVLPPRPSPPTGGERAPELAAHRPLHTRGPDEDVVEMDLEGRSLWSAALGFVSKVNAPERRGTPWITWALSSLFLALVVGPHVRDFASVGFGAVGRTLRWWIGDWGFLPGEPLRHGGLTFATAFALHTGLLHAAGNAYFLLLAGEDLEGLLGRVRFVALLSASTVLGYLLHARASANPSMPTVGASGGISGLMAYYAMALPQVKVGIPLWSHGWRQADVRALQLRIRVRWMLVVWVGLQVVGASTGGVGVAYMAHLGGALAGLLWWFTERVRASDPVPPPA